MNLRAAAIFREINSARDYIVYASPVQILFRAYIPESEFLARPIFDLRHPFLQRRDDEPRDDKGVFFLEKMENSSNLCSITLRLYRVI